MNKKLLLLLMSSMLCASLSATRNRDQYVPNSDGDSSDDDTGTSFYLSDSTYSDTEPLSDLSDWDESDFEENTQVPQAPMSEEMRQEHLRSFIESRSGEQQQRYRVLAQNIAERQQASQEQDLRAQERFLTEQNAQLRTEQARMAAERQQLLETLRIAYQRGTQAAHDFINGQRRFSSDHN